MHLQFETIHLQKLVVLLAQFVAHVYHVIILHVHHCCTCFLHTVYNPVDHNNYPVSFDLMQPFGLNWSR